VPRLSPEEFQSAFRIVVVEDETQTVCVGERERQTHYLSHTITHYHTHTKKRGDRHL
jgi:hypothetical protein